MLSLRKAAGAGLLAVSALWVSACGNAVQASADPSSLSSTEGSISYAAAGADPLATYSQTGDTGPVHDPSIIREGNIYYAFTTDVIGLPARNFLPIRCSQDKVNWRACGSIFPTAMPGWVVAKVPGILGLWAPDVSYFNGEYHVYYAGSTLGSQQSVIGLVTNTTLDATDPHYQWVDRGEVLESRMGDDFNAIDPNIFIDGDGSIWMTYGSYWTGIKQRQVDPATGLLLASNPTRYSLATRPGVPNNPIEGASLVHHGDYYYLFVSIDYCCNQNVASDNYKEAVGRSTGPHGPFYDESGTPMMKGGGTVLLQANADWNAPGGGTAWIDGETGESLLIFHALHMTEGGAMYQWVKELNWVNDWPVIGQ